MKKWATVAILAVFVLGCAVRNPHIASGRRRMQKSMFEEAEVQFKKAIELEPGSSEAHMWLGKSYAVQRKYVEAADEFDKAISLNPGHKDELSEYALFFWAIYYNSALGLGEQQHWKAAEKRIMQAIKIMPDSADGDQYLSYIRANLESGEEATAEETLRKRQQEEKRFEKKFEHDFREASWGMTRVEVDRREKRRPINEDENMMCYKGDLDGFGCIVYYGFTKDRLANGTCVFSQTHSSKNDYISDYRHVRRALSKRYGKSFWDREIWGNDRYRHDHQNWGLAISLGQAVFYSRWETLTTKITLILSGENQQISHRVIYESKP